MNDAEYRRHTRHYIIGFIGAALLTGLAYASVKLGWMNPTLTAAWVLGLAVVQFAVQIYFFLHLGDERKPRWHTWTFVYAMAMMIVVVAGSLWVMYNLNYRMGMSGEDMDRYMIEQNKKGF